MSATIAYEPPSQTRSKLVLGAVAAGSRRQDSLTLALAHADLELSACAETAEALAGAFDVVILYADGDPEELLQSVRHTRETLPQPILIVIWPPIASWNTRRALRAGADALVGEAELEQTLATTLEVAVSGLMCVPRQMRAPLETESLSMREKQVLGMLVRGCTNTEIAARLYLAESTVKSHLSSAYNKLGVRSRKDAATMILDPAEGLGPGILGISAA